MPRGLVVAPGRIGHTVPAEVNPCGVWGAGEPDETVFPEPELEREPPTEPKPHTKPKPRPFPIPGALSQPPPPEGASS